MKKLSIGALLLAVVALFAVPSLAFAGGNHHNGQGTHATSTANPHHEEADGCDHGNTGKPCKPDPQPNHGKDCVKHGNHGGINEDHCKGGSTSPTTTKHPTKTSHPTKTGHPTKTTSPPVTSSTTSSTTTSTPSTSTGSSSTSSTTNRTTSSTAPPSTTSPGLRVTEHPPTGIVHPRETPPSELASTGVNTAGKVLLALLAVGVGVGCWILARRRRQY